MSNSRLYQNIMDQIKEAQIKLGYARETIRLYYPVASLNGLLGTNVESGKEMGPLLRAELDKSDVLGHIGCVIRGDRVELSVPPEGAEYVHEHVPEPVFLKAVIELFHHDHHCSLEQVKDLFRSHSETYHFLQMPAGTDFDYVFYFDDKSVDEYYYCIKMEMGHTIYHRFTKEDYEMLMA